MSEFFNSLKSDPKLKQKILFIVGVIVGLILLGFLIYYINFGRFAAPKNNSSASFSSLPQVTNQTFEEATKLEKMDLKPLGYAQMWINQDKNYTFDQELKLQENFQQVASSPTFAPQSLYVADQFVIINQATFTTVYQDKQFKNLPPDISQVTPFNSNFLYILKSKNVFNIKQTSDLTFSKNVQNLGIVKPNFLAKLVEIRVLNNRIYIVAYQENTAQGNVEIWATNNGNAEKVQSLNEVQSIQFGASAVLYTSLNVNSQTNQYGVEFVDFSNNLSGQRQALDLYPQLRQQNIQGNLWAQRCVFVEKNKFLCLIKQNKARTDSYKDNDLVISYDLNNKKLQTEYDGLFFSADSIYVAQDKQLYVIGQENRLLYKLK